MTAFYNEIDPFAAEWLRELIKSGHIAPGIVDTRSIEDVNPDDLKGFKQCHFFAGIGVWSYALRQAGWPDEVPIWTGSCPCQPFSQAGKGGGFADERHLWPSFFRLIKECKPITIFGEQVSSSTVLGSSNEKMQKMLRGKALFEFQKMELFDGRLSAYLQDMYATCGKNLEEENRKGKAIREKIQREEPGGVCNYKMPANGNQQEPALQFGSAQSGSHKAGNAGGMRVDGVSSQSKIPTNEKSKTSRCGINRPDRLQEGIHDRQHTNCLYGRQFSLGNLGGRRFSSDLKNVDGEKVDDAGEYAATEIDRDITNEKAERVWIDIVFDDLESVSYAVAASDIPAAGFGAPHIRQRLYWMANAHHQGSQRRVSGRDSTGERAVRPNSLELQGQPGPTNGHWRDADWIYCRDVKWRPVEPGTFPLANRTSARVVLTCTCCETETRWMNGQKIKTDTIEVLQTLQCEDGEEEPAVRFVGGAKFIQSPGLLQRSMLWRIPGEDPEDERGGAYTREADKEEAFLQSVQRVRSIAGSPHRSEPVQQPPDQPGGIVHPMPSGRTSTENADIYLRGLQSLVYCAEPSEPEQNLFCPVCGDFRAHQCTKAMGSRVGELRGYGNALVAEQAKAFIESVMETISIP